MFANSNSGLKILVVDDHRLFRESLAYVLQEIDPNVIITEASSPDEANRMLEINANWDLVLFDLHFPFENIWGCLSRIRYEHQNPRVGILSGSFDLDSIRKAIELNVAGLISKTSSARELINGIRNILAGDFYLSADLQDIFLAATRELEQSEKPKMTERQYEVLSLLATGLSNKAIANMLDISESTTKQHVSAIIHSLKAKNRTDAVIKSQHLGEIKNSIDND